MLLGVFIVCFLALNLLVALLNYVFKFPALKHFDAITGGVLGFVRGYFLVFLLFTLGADTADGAAGTGDKRLHKCVDARRALPGIKLHNFDHQGRALARGKKPTRGSPKSRASFYMPAVAACHMPCFRWALLGICFSVHCAPHGRGGLAHLHRPRISAHKLQWTYPYALPRRI